MAARDEPVALQQLERLPQGHEGDPELARQAPLIVEPLTGRGRARRDALAEALGDLVIAGHSVHRVSSASVF